MKFFKLGIIFTVIIFFVSCNKGKKIEKSGLENPSKKVEKKLAENFEEFNKKFHSDSIFQISRVDFPIEGKYVSGFDQHYWTKKNWEFQIIPVSEKSMSEEYLHSLVKTDSVITERFWIQDSGFEVERTFKLINNKWFLVYYNDINL